MGVELTVEVADSVVYLPVEQAPRRSTRVRTEPKSCLPTYGETTYQDEHAAGKGDPV